MSAEWSQELEFALHTASEAAQLLLNREGSERIRVKGRADLVTEVDEAAERLIQARVQAEFPHDGFIAEEFSASARPAGRRWIVDPLDGTVNFVHGHPFSCVSIALVDDEGPAVGVVHAPFLGEIYHAARGGGAFLNAVPIRVSAVCEAEDALLATGFPFKAGKADPDLFFQLVSEAVQNTHGVRRAGSAALDLAYVAAGRVDAHFEVGLAPWDLAAGTLLVLEAGGVVTGWPGDRVAPLESGRVLASNGAIHRWLEELTGKYVHALEKGE